MYTAQDIEVFVLTHKRPDFLKDTLDCYLNQTVQGFRLAVFSNGHSPETKQLLGEYAARGVESFYVDEEMRSEDNHARALVAASRKVLVMAHDDDFIHPRYIEHLLALLNKYPQLSLIISGHQSMNKADWQTATPDRQVYHLKNKNEFAAYIYSGGGFAFSSACYKTDFVKRADPYTCKPFGKVGDVPFMVAACGAGEAAVTCFPFIQARIHAGQDSYDYATGPHAQEWFNLSLFYRNLLERPEFPRLRLVFYLQNYRHIRIGWHDWCCCEHEKMTWGQFFRQALACGALCYKSLIFGTMVRGSYNHYFQRKIAKLNVEEF